MPGNRNNFPAASLAAHATLSAAYVCFKGVNIPTPESRGETEAWRLIVKIRPIMVQRLNIVVGQEV